MFTYLRTQANLNHHLLAEAIKQKVAVGDLAAGEKLPTLSELSSQTGLASYSVRKAIATLVDAGILQTEQGGGVYVSDNCGKIKIALADAFRFSESGPEICHPRTLSGIYSGVNDSVVVDLLRPDTDFTSAKDILDQVETNGYNGIIWLYPEDDRMECIRQVSKKLPVVITSHSRIEMDIPTVESDEAWNAARVGRYFLDLGVDQVVQFIEPWIMNAASTSINGGHSGGISSLKYTLFEGGCDNFQTVTLSESQIKYRDILINSLSGLKDGSGVFIANTECFQAVLDADFENIVSELSRMNVVLATSEDILRQLSYIAERIDFKVCVNPLARIGAASLQKILNILSGMNEDTSTIVRIKFGDYNQMAEKSEMTACAV